MFFYKKDVVEMIKTMPFFTWEKSSIEFFMSTITQLEFENQCLKKKVKAYWVVWEQSLEKLELEFMGKSDSKFEINFDVLLTPYTLYVTSTSEIDLASFFSLSKEDLVFCKELYHSSIFPYVGDSEDEVNIVLRILIAPPFILLDSLLKKAYYYHQKILNEVNEIVINRETENKTYERNIGLYLGSFFLPQKVYNEKGKRKGLDLGQDFRQKKLNVLCYQ